MPSVTAIALETLLEPCSSASSHHHRCHAASNPSPSSPPYTTAAATTSASTSLRDHHHHHLHFHHHHGARREQQPIFLSRQPRDAPHSATASRSNGGGSQAAGSRAKSSVNGYYISPKLYTTPEPTRIVPTVGVSSSSSSPTSVSSPSPYVVNYKRRGVPRSTPPPSPMATAAAANDNGASSSGEVKSHRDGFNFLAEPPYHRTEDTPRGLTNGTSGSSLDGPVDELARRGAPRGQGIKKTGQEDDLWDSKPNMNGLTENECRDARIADGDEDDFFDPRELSSAISSSDTEDTGSFPHGGAGRCDTPLANQSEFYDATEDFFSDCSASHFSPSFRANIEAELRSIRLNLFEEIDRRKKAEEALDHMQIMFHRIARQLSQVGLPSPPIQHGGKIQSDADSAAQLCQEVVVLRAVSEALESVMAQVETEATAEAIIEAKNHEISRLRDRLQYYEAMNQEMSHRNQEAIELARRRRQKRRVRRRCMWGCIGLSITVGTSLMAYSYLMHGGKNPSLASSEHHDPCSGKTASGG